ncbi:hypothetical protein QC763_310330 [Podospora pseudopauciseta]|uniref:C2H2-type domain-containing protein n=1 Tax=Podospora pseudopauciseta TaxID=2093780 RepID=A0ABR0HI52_9PEZI|nr:hypothetical protein QC763_310330 [Podospora pseudopauciseta]
MSQEDGSQTGAFRWAWCIVCGQSFTPPPRDITAATTAEVCQRQSTSSLYYTTCSIVCVQLLRSYSFHLGLSALTLEENNFPATTTELNDNLHDVSSHQSPDPPLVLDNTDSRESSFSPPQPLPLPFTLDSFAYGTELFPPLFNIAPPEQDQPGHRVTGGLDQWSPGPFHREKKESSSVTKKPNSIFQCLFPGCNLNLRESRALNRHIWSEHREWAQANNVERREEIKCPHPGCPRRGRKDNIMRHFRTKHKETDAS